MRLVLIGLLLSTVHFTNAQSDTAFIRMIDDPFGDAPTYVTDTVVFSHPNARDLIFGNSILPSTDGQMNIRNFGLLLTAVNVRPCQSDGKPEANRVLSIKDSEDSLVVNVQYQGNCCHSFLFDVKIEGESYLSLLSHGYGKMWCFCTCCFGLEYQFEKDKGIEGLDKIKGVLIDGDITTLTKLN